MRYIPVIQGDSEYFHPEDGGDMFFWNARLYKRHGVIISQKTAFFSEE
jgi:hypothetical protein